MTLQNFVAIDVETANYCPTSICSVGCVKVVDGVVHDSYYSLVRPEPDYYIRRFTAIHGLSDSDTWNARTFDAVWAEVLGFADGLPFVAHNAAFDYRCICETCRMYGLDIPERFHCTLVASRRKLPRYVCPSHSLPDVCRHLGIDFDNHHNALADAEGCARIAIKLFRN